ncbi:hypothetical protein L6452_36874 [Arctium lappa]|uniref:Uncharacterized protein n=1 Tax=Arctium lappa TaxID=4217 RepID=A0ACB8Y2Y4_ARCLA|nr:hypothetical protein L6452_36874 [Arctium lappa]
MRGRSQGEVKEIKSLNVYLLIKIRSKILFSQLFQILLLFLLRTPQFIQDHSKELALHLSLSRSSSDLGLTHDFVEFCATHGIIHQTTTPYTPQQNGVDERKTRTLKNMMNSMLITSRAPHHLWGEACLTANMILNRIPHKKNDKTPYELWRDGISNNTIMESAEAEFFETIFCYKEKEGNTSNPKKRPIDDTYSHVDLNKSDQSRDVESSKVQEELEPRRSKRGRVAKDFGPDFMAFNIEGEPLSIRLPSNLPRHLIGKRLFKAKSTPLCKITHGNWLICLQARLVAKGYRQKEGQDFFDTYSPVTRITSIRMLVAITAIHNLKIHQMDVKTAFLNGELEEEIYMQQPEGFIVKGQENKVWKLVKSLYGLKQTPKQWHEKFDDTMLSNGFHINKCDKCVYVKQYKSAYVIICLYVDDMLIMGSNLDVINQTKKMLHSAFDMKDMGVADVILGIKIQRSDNGYILTQSHYVEKVLRKFGHYDDKPVVTPFDPSSQLKKNQGDSVAQLEYTQVLGSLMYIMNCTRLDIVYSVSRLSRYSHNPGKDHWYALCDANWISNHSECKSTSGYVFTLGDASISWKSSKQTVNTRSNMEAKFVALDKVAEEAEWLKSFLEGIPLWPKPMTAICIHCDSMAALTRAKNQIYNCKSRHIRRCHNTIKDLLKMESFP